MASGAPTTEINGINLEDYFPSRRSYNSVVYIHKKFFNNTSEKVPVIPEVNESGDNAEPKHKERKKKTKNKEHKKKTFKDVEQTSVNNDEVLGQTIRFAKNIVPIVIPPNNNHASPVYYTIKTSRKSRTRDNSQPRDSAQEKDPLTYKKQQEKKIIESFRKEKFRSQTESCSHESTSRSSIENIVISQSLNSTISEISERRIKKSRHGYRGCNNNTHIAASESLEAMATELLHTTGEAKIKIHLMDDAAKDLFYESIRKPVIEAIKESVAEVIHSKENSESKIVHKYVQFHNQKLDNILDKLACIEKRLDDVQEKAKPMKVKGKPSALEEIGEDMSDGKDEFENDVTVVYSAAEQFKNKCPSAAARLNPLQKIEEVSTCSGDGDEIIRHNAPHVMPERPNRIPTRYCWTDSTNQ